ncbi:uncharacterized protein CLUP02_08530 [Colletotrichum lupini]|uniref:Uncharacterized protein n=1 Tax=Colletotrichum lupini TaxID=145971 RepID=A0A9Q8STA2_9PEZI|nr:uncharacterized protein CLUP02_08530 [Colletotrichum lupini]UQC83040.1 hypothetical protein CLUP02_08530 [Colletotrichum lupini]
MANGGTRLEGRAGSTTQSGISHPGLASRPAYYRDAAAGPQSCFLSLTLSQVSLLVCTAVLSLSLLATDRNCGKTRLQKHGVCNFACLAPLVVPFFQPPTPKKEASHFQFPGSLLTLSSPPVLATSCTCLAQGGVGTHEAETVSLTPALSLACSPRVCCLTVPGLLIRLPMPAAANALLASRMEHNQEPGALLAQHCGSAVIDTFVSSPKTSSEKMMGDAFWLSSPSSFNVGLDSPQLAAAQVTLAALAPWWEQWQTIVLWSAGLLPIFSSLPARGSKQEQPAMTDVASLANHPPDSRFPPPINAQSMGRVNSELAQMFPPTAADSESFWQTNRVMNASASHPSLGKADGSPHQEHLHNRHLIFILLLPGKGPSEQYTTTNTSTRKELVTLPSSKSTHLDRPGKPLAAVLPCVVSLISNEPATSWLGACAIESRLVTTTSIQHKANPKVSNKRNVAIAAARKGCAPERQQAAPPRETPHSPCPALPNPGWFGLAAHACPLTLSPTFLSPNFDERK